MARDDACNCFCVMQTCGTNHTEHTLHATCLQPVVPAVVAAESCYSKCQPASLSLDFVTENIKHLNYEL